MAGRYAQALFALCQETGATERAAADLGPGEKGIERLNLLFGQENRTLDETLQIRAGADQFREGGEIGGGLFRRPGFLTEREERLRIAPRHPGHACHLRRQSEIPKFHTAAEAASQRSGFSQQKIEARSGTGIRGKRQGKRHHHEAQVT